jgi:hypothetical protein
MRDRTKLKLIPTKYSRNEKKKTQQIKLMARVGFEKTISVLGRYNAKCALDGSMTVTIKMEN